MKFDKAYCVELDEVVTPYTARDYHFDEEGDWYLQKLRFRCEDERCRADLTPVNIYSVRRIKMPLHFRTWPGVDHTRACGVVKSGSSGGTQVECESAPGAKEVPFKLSFIPDVFLLERPDRTTSNRAETSAGGSPRPFARGTSRGAGTNRARLDETSPYVTSFLENVVDCYNSMTPEERRSHYLRIEDVRKTYEKIFKRIIYFKDGPGLIYYGAVSELRNFGGDYRIKFRDLIWEDDGRRLRVSIYLEKSLIEGYRRSRLLRRTLQEMSMDCGELICYFVGAYPQLKRVRGVVNGVENEFDAYEVKITNLDHLVVTFS